MLACATVHAPRRSEQRRVVVQNAPSAPMLGMVTGPMRSNLQANALHSPLSTSLFSVVLSTSSTRPHQTSGRLMYQRFCTLKSRRQNGGVRGGDFGGGDVRHVRGDPAVEQPASTDSPVAAQIRGQREVEHVRSVGRGRPLELARAAHGTRQRVRHEAAHVARKAASKHQFDAVGMTGGAEIRFVLARSCFAAESG